MSAESAGPKMGTTFTVELPVLASFTTPVTLENSDAVPIEDGHGRRILVVDDGQDAARSMAKLLRLMGNEVRTAHDGIEAVEAAEEFRPEIILMDIGMPRLNGYEATRRIRQRTWGQSVRIIALSGWGQRTTRCDRKRQGAMATW